MYKWIIRIIIFLLMAMGHFVALTLVFTGGVRWDSGMFLTALMLLMGLIGLVSLVFGFVCLALFLIFGLFGLVAFILSFIMHGWVYALASGILLNVASFIFTRSKEYGFCFSRTLAYSETFNTVVHCNRPLLCRMAGDGVYENVWPDKSLLDRIKPILSYKSLRSILLMGTLDDGRAVAGYYDGNIPYTAICSSIYECIPNTIEWIDRLGISVIECNEDLARLVAGLSGARCREESP